VQTLAVVVAEYSAFDRYNWLLHRIGRRVPELG
jgi:hypothetical protein